MYRSEIFFKFLSMASTDSFLVASRNQTQNQLSRTSPTTANTSRLWTQMTMAFQQSKFFIFCLIPSFLKIELGNRNKPPGVEDGRYFFIITASSHASLSIAVAEKSLDRSDDPNNFIVRSLHQGEYVSDTISRTSDSRYYSFQLNLGKEYQGVNLSVVPKRGNFILAV